MLAHQNFIYAVNNIYNNNISSNNNETNVNNNKQKNDNKMHLEDNIREEKEDLLSFIQVSQECKPDTNENIISKLGLIQRLCVTRQISKEEANLVEKKMDDILKILNKTDRIHETKEKVNIRKKNRSSTQIVFNKKKKN